MNIGKKLTENVKPIAQTGLIAKAIVYCLLGLLVLMAAMNMGGHSEEETDKTGVVKFVYDLPGGEIILAAIALGLICYCIWRGIKTFLDTEHKGNKAKGLAARLRYLFSGLIYAALAAYAIKVLFSGSNNSGDSKQGLAQKLLSEPMGEWLVGAAALIFIGVGIYQVFYGLSEKYRKHADKAGDASTKRILLMAGKVGYVARGIVWLLIGWLFLKAALHSNSSEAGDTSKAFGFLSKASYGPYLLFIMGFGLICYGIFNFVRVRYEKFD
ncbi:MAG: hypothetical protein K0S09_377 [Sphingobacteriaceae bacterium]|jgi:hypothetical protein|nr:hypothetical protein [Sphingobacteriaceae bacterium]